MTEVPDTLTPAQVGRFLMGLARRLDELVAEFKELGNRYAVAKRDAVMAEARAWLEADDKGHAGSGRKYTAEDKKRIGLLASADLQFTADLTKAELDACREAIRALQTRIDVGRTLSATSREEMRMAGGPSDHR